MSSLNISRNEIADIFQCLLPKDVAMYLSSYHRHPIDEFIGSKNLRNKERTLSVRSFNLYRWNECGDAFGTTTYFRVKIENKDKTNYKLSTASRLRLFYPFTHRNYTHYTKKEIHGIARNDYIKLSMNWKKDKMIEEFYKRSN